MNFIGLDLETAPCEGQPDPYALQPWRAIEGTARITSCAISRSNRQGFSVIGHYPDIKSLLKKGKGSIFATWNGIFDIAWLHACGQEVGEYQWVDAMLLWKWHLNGQRRELMPDWSLKAATEQYLLEESWVPAYLELKEREVIPGEDDEYWELRGQLDALATVKLAELFWSRLNAKQRRSAAIESQCLVPVAESWVRGVDMDVRLADEMAEPIQVEMTRIENELRVTSKVLSSPKQMGELLYDSWGLPVEHYTPKGARAANKTALTYLADKDPRATKILAWRKLNTQMTKFIKGSKKCLDYLGSNTTHPQPRLFSTYTGRMTYSTRSGNKGEAAKAKIGVPLHQWPRPKELRRLLMPPEGYLLVELDASGQEMRLMAEKSQDENLLHIFRSQKPFDDAHSFTGAQLSGLSFAAFLKGKADGNKQITGTHGYRYQGKFTNLSCQYRIGTKSLRIKIRVDYGMDLDFLTTKRFQDTYLRAYPGVKAYWTAAIRLGQELGFAETIAGRRFRLEFWDAENYWGTSSSAINHPIQGTGADMKELALANMTLKFPEFKFAFDLHDGLFFYLPVQCAKAIKRKVIAAREMLNNLDYQSAWGWTPSVPLPWDASVGKNWGEMEEL